MKILQLLQHVTIWAALIAAAALTPVAASAADQPTINPARVGLSAERLKRLGPVMERYIAEEKLAGITIAVMREGKLAHLKHYGMADRERGIPMADDTIFRIHAMTKPITSVALMMLYEEGKFQLTDPVSMYVPAFKDLQVYDGLNFDGSMKVVKAHRAPTMQDLMTHTAGFSYGASSDPISQMYQKRNYRDYENGTLKSMIENVAGVPLLYQPGERWVYSIAVDIQGHLVEVLSGQTFDVFLKERIFDPLGMVDTGFYVPASKVSRFAAAYRFEDGKMVLADDPQTSRYLRKPSFFSGSGGLVSTTSDYLRFAQAMLNGGTLQGKRILSPKTVELMTQNHLADGVTVNLYHPANMGFGLGVQVRTSMTLDPGTGSLGEYGWGGAASTYYWADPEEQLIGLFMTQFYPSNTYRVRPEFHTLVYQAIVE